MQRKKLLDYEDLNDQPFLLLEHGGKNGGIRIAGEKPRTSQYPFYHMGRLRHHVNGGAGTGDRSASRYDPETDSIPDRDPIHSGIQYFREIGLAMKDRTKLTPATRKFIEYLTINERLERL